MTVAGFVGVCGALLAGTLLCAGVAKLAVPAHSSRAIAELLPAAGARAILVTRLLAAVETGVALALTLPALRDVGAAAAAALGAVFAASGAIAAVRGFRSPCGCFGRAGQRPMGLRNVAYGLALVAASAVLLFDRTGGWSAYAGLPMAGTAAVALLLAGWLYRDMIRDLGPTMRSTG